MSNVLNAAVSLVVEGKVPPDQLAWVAQLPEALPPEFLIHVKVAADSCAPASSSETKPSVTAHRTHSRVAGGSADILVGLFV
jgi:hypothetical protein